MIELIYGPKGSGKTQKIIESANEKAKAAKGNVVFLTDKDKYSLDIDNDIRFVVASKYGIGCPECTLGFIKGMMAANTDICNIYIDGIARIIGLPPEKSEAFYKALESISADCNVDFTVAVSTAELPKFMKRYI